MALTGMFTKISLTEYGWLLKKTKCVIKSTAHKIDYFIKQFRILAVSTFSSNSDAWLRTEEFTEIRL